MRRVLPYVGVTAMSGLSAVIAIPLLVRTLDLKNFGLWGVLETAILLASQLLLAGTNFAVFEAAKARPELAESLALQWLPKVMMLSVAALPILALISFADKVGVRTGVLVWSAIASEMVFMLSQSSARAAEKVGRVARMAAARALIWLGLLFALPRLSGMSAVDAVLGIRALSSLLPASWLLAKGSRMQCSAEFPFREAVRYGTPIALGSSIVAGGEFVERTLLAYMASLEVAGQYLLAYKYAAVLTMGLLSPIGLWWPRERARLSGLGKEASFAFGRLQIVIVTVCFGAATLLIVLSPILMPLLASGRSTPAIGVIVLVQYAVMMKGLMPILGPGAMERGSTWISPVAISAGALVQVALLVMILPKLGIGGAAVAALLGVCVSAATYVLLADGVFRVRAARWVLLALVFVAGGAMAAFMRWTS